MPSTEATTRYPVLDESGAARRWLQNGRGIAVWQSQEIGVPRSDMLTPGDVARAPHWAYRKVRTLQAAEEVVFYQPVRIVKSWRDTPQGVRAAALAHASETYKATHRGWATTYTLKRYAMGSIEIRPDGEGGIRPLYRMPDESVPTLLDIEFRIGIVEWSAKLDEEPS